MDIEDYIMDGIDSMNLSFTKGVEKFYKIHDTWQWDKLTLSPWQSFAIIVLSVLAIILGAIRSTMASLKEDNEENSIILISRRYALTFPVFHGLLLMTLFLISHPSPTKSKTSQKSDDWMSYLNPWNLILISMSRTVFFTILLPLTSKLLDVFDRKDGTVSNDRIAKIITHALSLSMTAWFVFRMDWLINDIFGVSVCILFISEVMIEDSACIIISLVMMAFADIFWVFFTDVMVSTGRQFQGIMLKIPYKTSFYGLGLGDIAIPGIYLALLLRFDNRNGNSNEGIPLYFISGIIGYVTSLYVTFIVSSLAVIDLPALLFLVPGCLIPSLSLAFLTGELGELLRFSDLTECGQICDECRKEQQ